MLKRVIISPKKSKYKMTPYLKMNKFPKVILNQVQKLIKVKKNLNNKMTNNHEIISYGLCG